MEARYHALVSVALASLFLLLRQYVAAVSVLVTGILIDVDHEVDYYVVNGKLTLSAYDLSEGLMNHNTYICPLHGWEYPLLLTLMAVSRPVLLGASLGWWVHLLLDMVTNSIHPLNLFVTYRILNDFRRKGMKWT
ncbi:MAG: hypothetical protein JRD89_00945 [Deltaproteobacteria bacterium]|nr:hypothetical protein [Deltaproteobacteria bacterium]